MLLRQKLNSGPRLSPPSRGPMGLSHQSTRWPDPASPESVWQPELSAGGAFAGRSAHGPLLLRTCRLGSIQLPHSPCPNLPDTQPA